MPVESRSNRSCNHRIKAPKDIVMFYAAGCADYLFIYYYYYVTVMFAHSYSENSNERANENNML